MKSKDSTHPNLSPAARRPRTATLIPVYGADICAIEAKRVVRTLQNVSSDSVFLIGPQSWRGFKSSGPIGDLAFVPFANESFSSLAAYSRFMLQPDIYSRFIDFEFVLICQLDAILMRSLPEADEMLFDYVGAPWVPPWQVHWSPFRRRLVTRRGAGRSKQLHVGNGGLSLRRTARFAQLRPLPPFKKFPNEDIVISYFSEWLGIRVAPVTVAEAYFMETGARSWRPGDAIPPVIGFHGLNRHNPQLEAQILAD